MISRHEGDARQPAKGTTAEPLVELRELARLLGVGAVSAELISPLRARDHHRAAFCVTLADGRRVKLRRMPDPDSARQLERLLTALRPAGLPRVLARLERALVVEWVPGEIFAKQPSSRDRITRAGALLGEIHRIGMQQQPGASASALLAAELARAEEQLEDLVGRRRLDRREADSLRARITQARAGSTRVRTGIVHGDFAPENLVVDETGGLRIVDNESIRPGILDLDLARVWARWPMPTRHWQAFLDAYAERAGRACSDAGLDGWKARALLVSAWYRTAFGLAGAAPALDHLRRFNAVPGRIHPASPGAEAS